MAYMPNFVNIFVSCTYLGAACEIEFVVDCVLAYLCKNVGSKCLFGMLVCELYLVSW